MPPHFPRKQVWAEPSHPAGPGLGEESPAEAKLAAWAPAPRASVRTTHPATLTESRLGPEPGPGAGREVWLILGRCFLGIQGSRAQSRRRGGLGSCSIRPAGPRHHGRSRQPPGLPRRWPGPRRMCWVRAGAGPGPGPPITQGLWFPSSRPTPSTAFPSSLSPPLPEGCPLALHPILPVGLQRESPMPTQLLRSR